ncbi:MAG: hypothetical protein ACYDCQ_10795, partial [Dehalococcoidia bacterium]
YHAEIDVPPPTRHDAVSRRGSYFATGDGVDIRAFQPVQPQLTFALPQVPGLTAHGAAVTGGAYTEMDGFDPIIVRPTWDQTEYEPQFHYAALTPGTLALINATPNLDGSVDQHLVLTVGQFISTADASAGDPSDPNNPYVAHGVAYPHSMGRERLYQHLSIDVYYSAGNSWSGPVLTAGATGCTAPGIAAAGVTVAGPSASRTTLVTDAAGRLDSAPLNNSGGGRSTGTAKLAAAHAGLTIQAVDAAGNVSQLALQTASDVGAGCPLVPPADTGTPTPTPTPPATSAPPGAQQPHESITITNILPPTFLTVAPVALVSVQGTWDTGGPRCDQQGSQWTIAMTAIGPAAIPAPLPISAPCGPDGHPAPWQLTLTLPAVPGAYQLCAGIANSVGVTVGTADTTGCQSFTLPPPPRQTPPTQTPTPSPTPVCNPARQKC